MQLPTIAASSTWHLNAQTPTASTDTQSSAVASTTSDDAISSTSDNPPPRLPPALMHSLVAKRLLTGGPKRAKAVKRDKKVDEMLRIPRSEFPRLGGSAKVAQHYQLPRTTMQRYRDQSENFRGAAHARGEPTRYAISHNNLCQLASNGRELCTAAGGLSELAAALGVEPHSLREVLTPKGGLSKTGGQRLVAQTVLAPNTVEIPAERFADLLAGPVSRGTNPMRALRLPSIRTFAPQHATPNDSSAANTTSAGPSTGASRGNAVSPSLTAIVAQVIRASERPPQGTPTTVPVPTQRQRQRQMRLQTPMVTFTTTVATLQRMQLVNHLRPRGKANDSCDPTPYETIDWRPAGDGSMRWRLRNASTRAETQAPSSGEWPMPAPQPAATGGVRLGDASNTSDAPEMPIADSPYPVPATPDLSYFV
ncbi:hypothetical protein PCA20602_01667 [Pandoraea capi]|uniref:HTH psq-type domain-containing protein n=1 Tax=Pandoraea capi TaxID=2508286 RepID=A0ABY6VV12_9BURK|nr:hypothetical protein [Pandoraea capi]VVD91769.1 hypothetical protein PCA20602_01667 [Pandoraea capi]